MLISKKTIKIKKTEKNDKNQENFEKKKKIVLISLSAAIVFITLIAGLLFAKKNKESGHENDDFGEIVDEENNKNENDNENEEENRGVIINGSDYFFEKKAGLVTINILSFLIIGILFFFWENDKISEAEADGLIVKSKLCGDDSKTYGEISKHICCRSSDNDNIGIGLFEKSNWFGFATLGALVVITFLVETVLNLLIGSISHLFSKDKSKRYLHTLGMSFRKRTQLFSSSKTRTLFIALGYLTAGIIVAMVARLARKYRPCCCRAGTGEIITGHGANYCFGFCEVSDEEDSIPGLGFMPGNLRIRRGIHPEELNSTNSFASDNQYFGLRPHGFYTQRNMPYGAPHGGSDYTRTYNQKSTYNAPHGGSTSSIPHGQSNNDLNQRRESNLQDDNVSSLNNILQKAIKINIHGPQIDDNFIQNDMHGPKIGNPDLDIHGPKIGGPELDIHGPKIGGPELDIHGPKIGGGLDIHGPKIGDNVPDKHGPQNNNDEENK